MKTLADQLSRFMTVMGLAALLLVPQMGYSQAVEEVPSAVAMTSDLIIARPLLLATTIIGTVAFIVSLPFSLAGGNTGEAAQTLVVGPARTTFVRCLGCSRTGYKQKVVNSGEE